MGIITLFHMPFFFLVSGFLNKERKIKDTVMIGLKRLLIPYFVMSSFCLFIMSVIKLIKGDFNIVYTIKIIIAILSGGDFYFTDPYSGPLWFCYSLFLIKLFESVACSFKYKNIVRFIFIILSFIVLYKGNILPFRLDSSLVGYIFFLIGFLSKNKIDSLINCLDSRKQNIKIILFSLVAFIILFFSAYFNFDFNIRPHLSINSCLFGKYPILFVIGGLSGTWILLVFSLILSKIFAKSNLILNISNGSIVILGYHWLVYLILFHFFQFSNTSVICALVVSLLNFIICYILILLAKKYFQIILGNRTIERK